MFHFHFPANNLRFPKFMALDFSNGVFDFQKEIDMDLTHVTTSVALKERTLRHISWPNETEGVFSEEAAF